MTADIHDKDAATLVPQAGDTSRMSAAMREGLDALQREYEAFRRSSLRTLVSVDEQAAGGK